MRGSVQRSGHGAAAHTGHQPHRLHRVMAAVAVAEGEKIEADRQQTANTVEVVGAVLANTEEGHLIQSMALVALAHQTWTDGNAAEVEKGQGAVGQAMTTSGSGDDNALQHYMNSHYLRVDSLSFV